MVILSENDYLDVKLNSLIADYDSETLSNLYQPIIGFGALAVYFTLVAEAKNQKITSLTSHNQLLNRLQMAPGDFITARKKLEGVGLLRTFLESNQNVRVYHYQIYAPKTPFQFFDDTLLFGMLIKALGETDANRFKTIYQMQNDETTGKDISSSFIDAYQPNFDDPAFLKAMNGSKAIGRRNGNINSEFNYDSFFTSLSSISQISQEAFTKKDMKEVERLATLNGIGESEAAFAVAECYDPYAGKGKHIDFVKLTKLFQEQTDYSYLLNKKINRGSNVNSGSSELAGKINIMETRSPKEFLALLQNGSKPATSDLNIVNDLSKNFHLQNGVINAIVDFVVTTNNNILSKAYCEKIAASLAREGVTTTIDAMNYLKKVSRGKRKESSKPVEISEKAVKTPQNNKNNSKTPLNWDELLDDIDGDDGGENGKA
jgi:replication initiation and membrane attachment protein